MGLNSGSGQGNDENKARIFAAVIGFLAGAMVGEFPGALAGGLVGFFIGAAITRANRVPALERSAARLRQELAELQDRLKALEARPAPPMTAEPAPASESLAPMTAPMTAARPAVRDTDAPTLAEAEPAPAAAPAIAPLAAPKPHAQDEFEPQHPASQPLPRSERFERMELSLPEMPRFNPFEAARAWLLGGNTLVRAGAVVLFFGLAFLVKFATEHTRIPVEFRYLGIGITAIALLSLGWRLRDKRPGYAMALQGLAVAILYLTTFAAYRLHGLLPGSLAFGLLVALCLLSAALAVLQDAKSMAVMGICGGFLAPILASSGGGSHIALFSYYALLNGGILAIAWFKAWRALNVLGFLFTFGVGAAWGNHHYHDGLFASTEAFLILFFLLYLTLSLLYARRRKAELSEFGAVTIAGERVDYVDGTLIFGTPLLAFGLQYLMVRDMAYGGAFSALALGALYLPLAVILYRRGGEDMRLLVESFLALGVVFASLAIPLGLDAQWTSAAWAVEGAGILWVSLRQNRRLGQAFGLLLQLGAGLVFADAILEGRIPSSPFNSEALGALLLAAAGFVSGLLLHRAAIRDEGNRVLRLVSRVCLAGSLAWWGYAGASEIERLTVFYDLSAHLLFAAGSAALLLFARKRLLWSDAGMASLLLLPLLLLISLEALALLPHPAARLGWLAWPAALAMLALVLHRQEGEDAAAKILSLCHVLSLWLFAGLATWQTWWAFSELGGPGSAWPVLGWALSPLTLLALLSREEVGRRWPVVTFPRAYGAGAVPLALGLWAWVFFSNAASNGSAAPLPYVPLLNPLDLANAGALLVLLVWLRRVLPQAGLNPRQSLQLMAAGLGSTAFVWLNGVLLRSLHHWAGLPFDLGLMLQSTLVQAALSLFWALLALGLMLTATRAGLRPVWLTGGVLMGAVVVKLFLVDLSRVGTIERIVSFIGVGLLLLVLGYFSPVPPRQEQKP